MKRSFIAVYLGLGFLANSSFLYAQDYIPTQNQNHNTIDVVVVNNSGQAITYIGNTERNRSTCNIIFPTPDTKNSVTKVIPAGGYFIAHAILGSGDGVYCLYNFTYANQQNLYLEVVDPTYYYGGSAKYKMFLETRQTVSSAYKPVSYTTSEPTGLMHQSDTVILNAL